MEKWRRRKLPALPGLENCVVVGPKNLIVNYTGLLNKKIEYYVQVLQRLYQLDRHNFTHCTF